MSLNSLSCGRARRARQVECGSVSGIPDWQGGVRNVGVGQPSSASGDALVVPSTTDSISDREIISSCGNRL